MNKVFYTAMRLLILVPILMLASFNLSAEIYKWVDEQGKTHYGDKPVNNAQQMEVDIEIKGNINTGQTRENRRKNLIDAFEEDRLREKKEKQKRKEKKEKHERKCRSAKDRLRRYERARYLYDIDSSGSRIVVPEAQRQKSTEALRQQVKKYCK
ncbi:hypothetical protein MNBD_GAMMA10-2249 [hydrothermal vent metagenome]|uniref:DUF4124 domain-containing protein n=1 Tax=hydrothermal vent metagenome TaxID=652676 RepID=A0A3B0XVE1_9ZZZZ